MRQKQFALIIGLIVILFGPALISSCEHEDHSQEPSDIDYVLIYNDSLGTITPVWPSDTSASSILVVNQNTEE